MNNLFSIFLVVVTIVPAKNAKEEKRKYSDDENDEHRIRSVQKKLFWLWGAALRKSHLSSLSRYAERRRSKGWRTIMKEAGLKLDNYFQAVEKTPIFMQVWFDFVGKETAE